MFPCFSLLFLALPHGKQADRRIGSGFLSVWILVLQVLLGFSGMSWGLGSSWEHSPRAQRSVCPSAVEGAPQGRTAPLQGPDHQQWRQAAGDPHTCMSSAVAFASLRALSLGDLLGRSADQPGLCNPSPAWAPAPAASPRQPPWEVPPAGFSGGTPSVHLPGILSIPPPCGSLTDMLMPKWEKPCPSSHLSAWWQELEVGIHVLL